MRRNVGEKAVALMAVGFALLACRSARREPAPASAPARAPAPARPESSPVQRERRGYTEADVRFVQGMIAHHAQALAMVELLKSRSTRPIMRLLGERIEVSQRDEIAQMQRWLRARGEDVPSPGGEHAHHAMPGDAGRMPGMLTPAQMAELAATTGTAFDRLFLKDMIAHHEGALVMVRELFATPGAGQEPELFNLASDVDADQRAEIDRMRSLLGTIGDA